MEVPGWKYLARLEKSKFLLKLDPWWVFSRAKRHPWRVQRVPKNPPTSGTQWSYDMYRSTSLGVLDIFSSQTFGSFWTVFYETEADYMLNYMYWCENWVSNAKKCISSRISINDWNDSEVWVCKTQTSHRDHKKKELLEHWFSVIRPIDSNNFLSGGSLHN